MKLNKKYTEGLVEQFSFPACIIQLERPFKIKFSNSLFKEFYKPEKEKKPIDHLLESFRIPLFSGREEIIGSILDQIIKEKESASFNLHPLSLSESNGHQFSNQSWLVEVTFLRDMETEELLLTFHKLSSSNQISDENSEFIKSNSLVKETRELRNQVDEKKAQYLAATTELDNFVYSVSHDLRAPLRRIDGFSQELITDYSHRLDETGLHYLERIRHGTQDMGHLIDDLLKLSRISRKTIERKEFDLNEITREEYDKLKELEPERKVELTLKEDQLLCFADEGLVRVILMNLLSNALKFTSKKMDTIISIGKKKIDGKTYFYVADNGAGFDPAHYSKLFRAFSRLHSQRDFEGTGIGLATVKRIIRLHAGNIFAESKPGEGATFYFNLNQ